MESNSVITLKEYIKEAMEQNEYLLNEMSKLSKNSEMYKLRWIQFQTNLLNIKINKNLFIHYKHILFKYKKIEMLLLQYK